MFLVSAYLTILPQENKLYPGSSVYPASAAEIKSHVLL
jgi:hypothetical protein